MACSIVKVHFILAAMDSLYRGILRNLFNRFWCLKCGDRFPFNLRLYHLFRLIILFSLAIYRSLMPLLPYFYIFYFIFLTKEI